MLPRLVTNSDLNFLESPHLGLASLMLEAGYVRAEDFVTEFKQFFESRSIYSFLRLYAYVTPASVSSCLYMFAKLLGDTNSESWQGILLMLAPSYTSGFSEVYNLIQASTTSNYKALLDWFDYPFIDVTDLITNPFAVLDWVQKIDPSLTGLNNKLQAMDISGFMADFILGKAGIDINKNAEYSILFRRWVNLAFTRYAYGADVNQIRWF